MNSTLFTIILQLFLMLEFAQGLNHISDRLCVRYAGDVGWCKCLNTQKGERAVGGWGVEMGFLGCGGTRGG